MWVLKFMEYKLVWDYISEIKLKLGSNIFFTIVTASIMSPWSGKEGVVLLRD